MRDSIGKGGSDNQNPLGFGEIKDGEDDNPFAGGASRGAKGGRRNQEGG